MAKAKAVKDPGDDKVFDVAKPGATPAAASAKPVIVGHKAVLQDPMVSPGSEAASDIEEPTKPATVSTTAPTIAPPSKQKDKQPATSSKPRKSLGKSPAAIEAIDTKEEKVEVKTKIVPLEETDPAVAETASETTEPQADTSSDAAEVSATDAATPSEADTDAESTDSAVVEATAEQATAQKEADRLAKEQAEKTAALEKIVEEKKYYAPIGEKKHRRTLLRTFLLLTIALLLALLLASVLVELEIIKTSIEPPIKLFNN